MDEPRNSAQEAQYALSKYLELFNSDCNFFKFYIEQIGVLEWFGRTVKGKEKIHDFLRFEVCAQYDHLCFEAAEMCEPFECRSAQLETKKLQTEQDVTLSTTLIDSSFAGDKTVLDLQTPIPFDQQINLTNPPGSITPPIPTKRIKHDKDYDPNRSLTSLLKIEDYFDRKETNIKAIPRKPKSCWETPDTTTVETPSCSNTDDYSELRYFETTGILRSSTQPEHRSFRNSSSSNGNGTWDRKTRIKISYKIRLSDNDIQFSLISYQNVHQYSLLSKRNLMSEFDKVATQKREAANERSIKKSIPNTPEVKRKMVRRLRLF